MCGQHAYQAPAPRPVCALDNESKARPAAQAQQTRNQDNENKESQLPPVEKTTIEAAPSLSLLHLTNVPSWRAHVHARSCAHLSNSNIFSTHKSCTEGKDLENVQ